MSSNVSTKVIKALLSKNNFVRLAVLLIGYFLGAYFQFLASNQSVLALGAAALLTPTIVNGVNYTIKQANNLVPPIYNAILSSAALSGGALYILYNKNILLPQVVVNGIKSILASSAATTTNTWLQQAMVSVTYCCKLMAVDLPVSAANYIASFIQSYLGVDIISNLSGLIYTTETVVSETSWLSVLLMSDNFDTLKIVQTPRFVFATVLDAMKSVQKFGSSTSIADAISASQASLLSKIKELATIPANSTAYNTLYNAIAAKLDIASIWLDANVPNVMKALAAAKAWMVGATNSCYLKLVEIVGPTNAPIICQCVGYVIAAMGAAWLVKKMYDAAFPKSISASAATDECLQEFGEITRIGVNIAIVSFDTIALDAPTAEWSMLSTTIKRGLALMERFNESDCPEYSSSVIKIFTAFASVAATGDKLAISQYFIRVLPEFANEIQKYGRILQAGGNMRNVTYVENINQAIEFELYEQLFIMRLKVEDGEKVDERRKQIDPVVFRLSDASESVGNQVPLIVNLK